MKKTPLALTIPTILAFGLALGACAGEPQAEADDAAAAGEPLVIGAGQPFADVPEETHLRNVRQLTFDGENAEAYFSFDGAHVTYQRTAPSPDGSTCDQIHSIDLATGATRMISTGQGRTTCSYYFPAGDRILYASTHHHDAACPARPDFSRGYVWPIYDTYDLFVASAADGSGLTQLTDTPGYDAEATISPRGDRMVFTSMRSGDLDLWSMNLDGSDARQITNRPGYDGGAFFSPDGSKIVWRAHYPEGAALDDYKALLADGLIRPTTLELWVANADGTDARQITSNGKANFAPYWHPSGQKILFSSNMDDPAGRAFDVYMINLDGTGLERITHTPDFDGFPMFSPDGRYLVWGSNRNMSHEANTNVFIAEWVEGP